ncbi:hypothetical protein BGX26_006621 [Mortierella sp. AD094]|nr:hypothetical protein BGX26_006621 [Mortierella sp. AD094]
MSSTHTQLRIAIVGAGLGGLALARTLQQNNIHWTVYELEASPNARVQGGSLGMNPKTGQEKLGKEICFEGDSSSILDKHGKVWVDKKAEDEDKETLRPEIDRGVMRQAYLDSLQPGTIQWGTKVSSIVKNGS